ncbi:MAG: 2-oxoglutarate and iron-dependent oxygenase domain-containing protein, partial [Synechococcaceae cyanobacterium]
MSAAILEVDLLRFERCGEAERQAVVDGVMRSLATGFVVTTSDLPEGLLDEAYGMLAAFFALPNGSKHPFSVAGSSGQTGYTGPLIERAETSDLADWKEMLNWSLPMPSAHPLRRRFPALYPEQLLPEEAVPGIIAVLESFHRIVLELQRRFLRVIAIGMGCHEAYFEAMVAEGPTLTRA